MIQRDTSKPTLRQRIKDRLGNEDGNVVGTAAFVMVAGLICATVATLVLTGSNTQLQADRMSDANQQLEATQQGYIKQLLANPPEADDGGAPGDTTYPNPLVADLGDEQINKTATVREMEAAYIAGYDDAGNPVWVDRLGAMDHRFGTIVSAGNYTCGLEPSGEDAGSVWCWGANNHHQLGNGSDQDATEPTQTAGTTKFGRLHQGTDNAICATARSTNLLSCWGFNEHGQLGKSSTGQDLTTPALVKDIDGRTAPAVKDAAGAVALSSNTLAIIGADGTLYAMGANAGIANGSSAKFTTPVPGVKFKQVVADANTVAALSESGDIYTWTLNGLGASGLPSSGGTSSDAPTFQPASHIRGTTLEVTRASVAIPAGQLSSEGGQHTPVKVAHPAGRSWTSVSIAPNDTGMTRSTVYATDSAAHAYAWGSDAFGQLGNTAQGDSDVPTRIGSLTGVKKISAGGSTAAAVLSDGTVRTWGAGAKGQLGNGTTTLRQDTPVAVTGLSGAVDVHMATGDKALACATLSDIRSTCWGANEFGQTGVPNSTPIITTPNPASARGSLSVGDDFVCGLDEFSKAYCWGRGELGETGRGHSMAGVGDAVTTDEAQAPAQIAKRDDTVRAYTGYINGGK